MAAESTVTPVTVYGVPLSQPVRAVLFACAYKGLPVELNPRMPGQKGATGTRSPEFEAINPWGSTIPAISEGEGGGAMWSVSESCAILSYLATKHGWHDLYPTEPRARAAVDRYMHWHHRNTREITLALFAPALRPDLNLSGEQVAAGRKTVKNTLAIIEKNLSMTASKPAFLCSSTGPTLADFCCYAELGQCKPEFCNLWDFTDLPAISSWMAAMEALPGFEESHEMLAKLSPKIRKVISKFNAKI